MSAAFQAFVRSKFAPNLSSIAKSASANANASAIDTTLRILSIPVAFRSHRSIDGRVTSNIYVHLYPIQVKHSMSLIKSGISELVQLWRSGLWVLGRTYRGTWNALFMPQVYHRQLSSGSKISLLDSARKKIFDWSDRVTHRWSTVPEEDLLRAIDSQAQITHHNQNLSIPMKKIQIITPTEIFEKCDYVLLPFKFTADGKTPDVSIQTTMQHLANMSEPHYSQLSKRTKIILAVTIPFYLIWPDMLTELDKMTPQMLSALGSTTLDSTTWWHDTFTKLVSLPLAFNLIRMFAYMRCHKSGNFVKQVLASDVLVRPELEKELQKLDDMRIKGNSSDMLALHRKEVEETLDSIGTHYTAEVSSTLVKCYDDLMKNSQNDLDKFVWIDKPTVRELAQTYQIPSARLYKDLIKATEKLARQHRITETNNRSP